MPNRLGIAACALFLAAPTVTAAQTPPPPPTPPSQPIVQRMDTRPGVDRMQSEAFNRALTTQAAVSPARAERAERVAELINEGKCEEAVAFARSEGDRRLANRAQDVCEAAPEAPSAPQ